MPDAAAHFIGQTVHEQRALKRVGESAGRLGIRLVDYLVMSTGEDLAELLYRSWRCPQISSGRAVPNFGGLCGRYRIIGYRLLHLFRLRWLTLNQPLRVDFPTQFFEESGEELPVGIHRSFNKCGSNLHLRAGISVEAPCGSRKLFQ